MSKAEEWAGEYGYGNANCRDWGHVSINDADKIRDLVEGAYLAGMRCLLEEARKLSFLGEIDAVVALSDLEKLFEEEE